MSEWIPRPVTLCPDCGHPGLKVWEGNRINRHKDRDGAWCARTLIADEEIDQTWTMGAVREWRQRKIRLADRRRAAARRSRNG